MTGEDLNLQRPKRRSPGRERVLERTRSTLAKPGHRWPGFSVPATPAIRPAAAGNDTLVGTDAGDIALTCLAALLGPVEVVAIGPPGMPLPVTGRCTRCGSTTTVYGPAGSPLCDRCRDSAASRPAKTANDTEPA